METEPWRIELLGALCARRAHHVITRFHSKKTGALLGLLACHERRLFRREELIDLIWPDYLPEAGRNCLRIALSTLRQQLVVTPEYGELVIADRAHVQLNPDAFHTDKADFETNLKLATQSSQEEEQRAILVKTVALYRGDLLPGYDEGWILGERQRLAEAYLLALRRLVKLLVSTRHFEEALEYAQRAAQADPLREETHRVLMRLYIAMGQPAAALRQYRQLEHLLKDELGALPSASTRELAAQVAGDADTPRNAVHSVNRAASDPDHTPQASFSVAPVTSESPSAGLASSPVSISPPSPSGAPKPFPLAKENLPLASTRFFGREACVDAICQMLARPDVRLLTLTGFGGSGKTRLALAVAQRLLEPRDGAVWFVPLASLLEPQLILDAIGQALGLPRFADVVRFDQLVQALAFRPGLLVLDNFEHLAEEGALLVQGLLDHLPRLTCLVTSRQRLRLTSEFEYPVKPLPIPEAADTPAAALACASVQLFVDRAQKAWAEFRLTEANSPVIADLCRRLEGVPLALELAATWTPTFTPAQILERLSSGLSLLTSRHRDIPARHASLRAALQWSFQALDPGTRRFFADISVFRGGFTLEAAEAVCPDLRVFEHLAQLQEQSLVFAEEVDTERRFGLLETLREYAQEQLHAEEQEAVARGHANYYLRLAEQAEPYLRGPQAPQWLDRLDREHDNFRAALLKFVEHPAVGLRMAGALWRFWYMRGYHAEGYDWLEKALAADYDGPISVRVKALNGAGNIAYGRCDYASARVLFEEVLALARESGDERRIAVALGGLGNVAKDQGEYLLAQDLLQQSLRRFQAQGDRRGVMLTIANLANVAQEKGDLAEACVLHRESLALFRQAGDTGNIIVALNNGARALMRSGAYTESRQLLEECLSQGQQLEDWAGLAECLETCASLAVRQQQMPRAAALLAAAESLRESTRTPRPPRARADYVQDCDLVRGALDETAFAIAWTQGLAWTIPQAIDCALAMEDTLSL